MKKLTKRAKSRKTFSRITFRDRVIIENRYCIDKKKIPDIAKELGRPRLAIYREINGKPRIGRGRYMAHTAQEKAEINKKNQGRKSKFLYEPLKNYVVENLKKKWSPEQVGIRIKIDYSDDENMRISYESIYCYIYSQIHREGNGKVKEGCIDLRKYLTRRHSRRQRKGFRKARKLERMANLPSIELRPKSVEKRKEIGNWEGDTMVSRQSSVRIKSLNERKTGIVFFAKTKDGTSDSCNKVAIERLKEIPSMYLKTLTQDRGTENMGYEKLEKELKLSCYFAHPYCSQERGSNENLNGLFRRYFPKKTNFDKITEEDIKKVEYLINSRPRKRFNGLTPYEMFYKLTGVSLDS